MKYFIAPLLFIFLCSCGTKTSELPEYYKHVDQTLCVVDNLGNVINGWKTLGFDQVILFDEVDVKLLKSNQSLKVKMALTNLGGANVVWIQPLEGESVFSQFHLSYGDGAMSLVHRVESPGNLRKELKRLRSLDLNVLEEVEILTGKGSLHYFIMDSRKQGKYNLGFVTGVEDQKIWQELSPANSHNLKINQYAFAIRQAEPVSEYWQKIGLPEFQINHPVLGNKHYYGKTVDHDLIQGWQRHGSVAYEWCIPVSTPIVYDDHIGRHGEGIHHLAFSTEDMDKVLDDYGSKSFLVSMGGTWGEEGKPGSGRYEYIDMEQAGGLTIELLWNFKE